jgi:hypothetical protein
MQRFIRFVTFICLLFVVVPTIAQPSRVERLFEPRDSLASTSVANRALFAGGKVSTFPSSVDSSWVEIFSGYNLWNSGTKIPISSSHNRR